MKDSMGDVTYPVSALGLRRMGPCTPCEAVATWRASSCLGSALLRRCKAYAARLARVMRVAEKRLPQQKRAQVQAAYKQRCLVLQRQRHAQGMAPRLNWKCFRRVSIHR